MMKIRNKCTVRSERLPMQIAARKNAIFGAPFAANGQTMKTVEKAYFYSRSQRTICRKKGTVGERLLGAPTLPFVRFFLKGANGERYAAVFDALDDLTSRIRGLPCTVIGLMHPNKKVDMPSIERILGSQAFSAFVRSVVLLRHENAEQTIVRMIHGKHNNSVKGGDLLFTKRNTKGEHSRDQYLKIDWERAESNIDVDKAFNKAEGDGETALSWLQKHLSDHEWHDLKEIQHECENYNIHTWDTVKKARERHKEMIESKTTGFGPKKVTKWRLKK